MMAGIQREDLGCTVELLEYDFQRHSGRLFLPDMNCTDMDGCIALFKAIDPDVQYIATFSGRHPDTIYRLNRDGWSAYFKREGMVVQ